jgi:hypothetical protein
MCLNVDNLARFAMGLCLYIICMPHIKGFGVVTTPYLGFALENVGNMVEF